MGKRIRKPLGSTLQDGSKRTKPTASWLLTRYQTVPKQLTGFCFKTVQAVEKSLSDRSMVQNTTKTGFSAPEWESEKGTKGFFNSLGRFRYSSLFAQLPT
jgi:hypothetical protein